MTEPDVALTDYAITLECAAFVYLLIRRSPVNTHVRSLFIGLFACLGMAAFLGGTVHGFFSEGGSPARKILWPLTLLMIGLVTLSIWGICIEILSPEKWKRYFRVAVAISFLIYSSIVILKIRDFRIAVVNYLPSTVVMMSGFYIAHKRSRNPELKYGIAGLMLTYLAAAVQQLRISLHPQYFNHDALYHVIQAVGLFLIYRGSIPLFTSRDPSP